MNTLCASAGTPASLLNRLRMTIFGREHGQKATSNTRKGRAAIRAKRDRMTEGQQLGQRLADQQGQRSQDERREIRCVGPELMEETW